MVQNAFIIGWCPRWNHRREQESTWQNNKLKPGYRLYSRQNKEAQQQDRQVDNQSAESRQRSGVNSENLPETLTVVPEHHANTNGISTYCSHH